MKVSQLRCVLATMADVHQKSGRSDDADALRKLAVALKKSDKEQVSKMVEKLTK
jgi:hypothetical protein